YRATLTRGGSPYEGQTSAYAGGTIETDADGEAWFGPPSGFTIADVALDDPGGVTTDFDTTFTEAGEYTLQVQLFDVTNGSEATDTPVGMAGSTTFTIEPAPITVCGSGCDHSSVQDAIDAASDGQTIEVGDG